MDNMIPTQSKLLICQKNSFLNVFQPGLDPCVTQRFFDRFVIVLTFLVF